MNYLKDTIERLAKTSRPVLIEDPTGKSAGHAARAIHQLGTTQIFVHLDSRGLNQPDLELALEEGEYGAGTTVFLSAITKLAMINQRCLVHALDQGWQGRLIVATGEDLVQATEDGRFYVALMRQLNDERLELAPLQIRSEDIDFWLGHFASCLGHDGGAMGFDLPVEVKKVLKAHAWPGEVPELEWVLEQALRRSGDRRISLGTLPGPLLGSLRQDLNDRPQLRWSDLPLRQARDCFERDYLTTALRQAAGNVSQAARSAGINRQYLHRKMKEYKIDRLSP